MAKKIGFKNLVESIQEAFIQVNDMSEAQHLKKMSEYFEDDGTPKVFEMQYPYVDGKGVTVEVDFKVQIYGEVPLKHEEGTSLCYVPHGGIRNKEDSYANIKLKFVSQEPPEGLVRLKDQFIKVTL